MTTTNVPSSPAQQGAVTYRGWDKNGVPRTGSTQTATPDELALVLFQRGYRHATLKQDDRVVGRIQRDDKGCRSWWAESTSGVRGAS